MDTLSTLFLPDSPCHFPQSLTVTVNVEANPWAVHVLSPCIMAAVLQIPQIKDIMRRISYVEACALTQEALLLPTAEEIDTLLQDFLRNNLEMYTK